MYYDHEYPILNAYNMFVKQNFNSIEGATFGEKMKKIAQLWKIEKNKQLFKRFDLDDDYWQTFDFCKHVLKG